MAASAVKAVRGGGGGSGSTTGPRPDGGASMLAALRAPAVAAAVASQAQQGSVVKAIDGAGGPAALAAALVAARGSDGDGPRLLLSAARQLCVVKKTAVTFARDGGVAALLDVMCAASVRASDALLASHAMLGLYQLVPKATLTDMLAADGVSRLNALLRLQAAAAPPDGGVGAAGDAEAAAAGQLIGNVCGMLQNVATEVRSAPAVQAAIRDGLVPSLLAAIRAFGKVYVAVGSSTGALLNILMSDKPPAGDAGAGGGGAGAGAGAAGVTEILDDGEEDGDGEDDADSGWWSGAKAAMAAAGGCAAVLDALEWLAMDPAPLSTGDDRDGTMLNFQRSAAVESVCELLRGNMTDDERDTAFGKPASRGTELLLRLLRTYVGLARPAAAVCKLLATVASDERVGRRVVAALLAPPPEAESAPAAVPTASAGAGAGTPSPVRSLLGLQLLATATHRATLPLRDDSDLAERSSHAHLATAACMVIHCVCMAAVDADVAGAATAAGAAVGATSTAADAPPAIRVTEADVDRGLAMLLRAGWPAYIANALVGDKLAHETTAVLLDTLTTVAQRALKPSRGAAGDGAAPSQADAVMRKALLAAPGPVDAVLNALAKSEQLLQALGLRIGFGGAVTQATHKPGSSKKGGGKVTRVLVEDEAVGNDVTGRGGVAEAVQRFLAHVYVHPNYDGPGTTVSDLRLALLDRKPLTLLLRVANGVFNHANHMALAYTITNACLVSALGPAPPLPPSLTTAGGAAGAAAGSPPFFLTAAPNRAAAAASAALASWIAEASVAEVAIVNLSTALTAATRWIKTGGMDIVGDDAAAAASAIGAGAAEHVPFEALPAYFALVSATLQALGHAALLVPSTVATWWAAPFRCYGDAGAAAPAPLGARPEAVAAQLLAIASDTTKIPDPLVRSLPLASVAYALAAAGFPARIVTGGAGTRVTLPTSVVAALVGNVVTAAGRVGEPATLPAPSSPATAATFDAELRGSWDRLATLSLYALDAHIAAHGGAHGGAATPTSPESTPALVAAAQVLADRSPPGTQVQGLATRLLARIAPTGTAAAGGEAPAVAAAAVAAGSPAGSGGGEAC